MPEPREASRLHSHDVLLRPDGLNGDSISIEMEGTIFSQEIYIDTPPSTGFVSATTSRKHNRAASFATLCFESSPQRRRSYWRSWGMGSPSSLENCLAKREVVSKITEIYIRLLVILARKIRFPNGYFDRSNILGYLFFNRTCKLRAFPYILLL